MLCLYYRCYLPALRCYCQNSAFFCHEQTTGVCCTRWSERSLNVGARHEDGQHLTTVQTEAQQRRDRSVLSVVHRFCQFSWCPFLSPLCNRDFPDPSLAGVLCLLLLSFMKYEPYASSSPTYCQIHCELFFLFLKKMLLATR